MHELDQMLEQCRRQAGVLDIPLDHQTCLKQLECFGRDDAKIREGYQMVY
jgi:hypothetical protein